MFGNLLSSGLDAKAMAEVALSLMKTGLCLTSWALATWAENLRRVHNSLRVSFEPSPLFQFHPELYQKDTNSFGDVSSQAVPGPLEACQQTQLFHLTLQVLVALVYCLLVQIVVEHHPGTPFSVYLASSLAQCSSDCRVYRSIWIVNTLMSVLVMITR